MGKKLLLFLAVCVVTLGNMAAYASAQTTIPQSNQQSLSDYIWSGLWAGVNGDFNSLLSNDQTQRTTTVPAATPPTTAPASPSTTSPQSTINQTVTTYAALGDSVAAGVGLPSPVAVPAEQVRCGRTTESYPFLVAARLGTNVTDVTCSGATAGDLFTAQRSGSPNLPPQLDTAFANGTPQIMTITAGANDLNWQQFLYICYRANCATPTQTALSNTQLAALKLKLHTLFTDIQLRSDFAPPTVLYTGYYNPVSTSCQGIIPSISNTEVTWITERVNRLNATIADVAGHYSFVRFVPINFTGHDLCSSQSWVQGLNDPQPIHPTTAGQQAIANSVISALGR